MRHFKFLTLVVITILGFNSCSDDDESTSLLTVESEQVSNLFAPQTLDVTVTPPVASGDFVKFDFSTGRTTTSDTDWDIALRGTTILVNGGDSSGIAEEPIRTGNAAAYIVDDTFANVIAVTESSFIQDSTDGLALPTGSGNGWYNYNPAINAIQPIAGKVIVFRTADDRYAKIEILSYYKDAPSEITTDIAANDARYYTFNYVL